METAVTLLPLPPRMRDALVSHNGPGRLLDCVQAIEQGHFNPVVRQLDHAARHYVAAVGWANETSRGLVPTPASRVAIDRSRRPLRAPRRDGEAPEPRDRDCPCHAEAHPADPTARELTPRSEVAWTAWSGYCPVRGRS